MIGYFTFSQMADCLQPDLASATVAEIANLLRLTTNGKPAEGERFPNRE